MCNARCKYPSALRLVLRKLKRLLWNSFPHADSCVGKLQWGTPTILYPNSGTACPTPTLERICWSVVTIGLSTCLVGGNQDQENWKFHLSPGNSSMVASNIKQLH